MDQENAGIDMPDNEPPATYYVPNSADTPNQITPSNPWAKVPEDKRAVAIGAIIVAGSIFAWLYITLLALIGYAGAAFGSIAAMVTAFPPAIILVVIGLAVLVAAASLPAAAVVIPAVIATRNYKGYLPATPAKILGWGFGLSTGLAITAFAELAFGGGSYLMDFGSGSAVVPVVFGIIGLAAAIYLWPRAPKEPK